MNGLEKKTNLLLWTSMFIIGFCFLGAGLLLWGMNYADFTTFVLDYVNKPSWRTYFEQEVFPKKRFALLRILIVFLGGCWLIGVYAYNKKKDVINTAIASFFKHIQRALRQQVAANQLVEKRFLLLLIIAVAIRQFYHLHHYELQYDEAWSYNHFVSKGFLVSAISPNNNHILYTLFACLTDYLPIEVKYSLRLPVYLAGFPTLLIFYWMLRSIWGWRWALVGLSWFAFCPSVTFYMMYARGYIFQLLFTIISCWAVIKISQGSISKPFHWAVFVIASILGFYSVPTQAYVWIAFNVFLIFTGLRGWLNWRHWLWANVLILVIVAILYFPFLITNGVTMLLDASNNAVYGEAFVSYQDKVSDWLLVGGGRGTAVYWFWLLLLLIIILLRWKRTNNHQEKNAMSMVLVFMFLPSILNLTIGTQPPFRVWCFLAIFIGMLFPIIGTRLEQKYWTNTTSNGLLILLSAFFILFNIARAEVHYALQWSADLDREAKKIANLLLEQKIEECYFFSDYDKPLLECYYLRNNQALKTAMIAPNSKNYAPFVNARLYQSVLWDNEDRVASKEEKAWLEQHYPTVLYKNKRIEVRLKN